MKLCDSLIHCQEERVVLFQKKGYPIKECKQCGHRYAEIVEGSNHVLQVYTDEYFLGGSAGYPDYLKDEKILVDRGERYAKKLEKFTPPGRILDVGCASGFILKGFENKGWICQGIEPNDTMASYGREQLNLNIHTGNLETFQSVEKFDLITLIQVVGHLYNLDKALSNISNLLKPDGFVLVESWNMKSTVARMLGKNWAEYSPPSVIHWFSDKTLTQLFEYYGFELIKSGRPVKQISVRHALALFSEKSPKFIFKRPLINNFNRAFGGITLRYPPVDLKWYLFKKKK